MLFWIYSGLWHLSDSPLVPVCTQWQVKHQPYSTTDISRKNTRINKHPVRIPLWGLHRLGKAVKIDIFYHFLPSNQFAHQKYFFDNPVSELFQNCSTFLMPYSWNRNNLNKDLWWGKLEEWRDKFLLQLPHIFLNTLYCLFTHLLILYEGFSSLSCQVLVKINPISPYKHWEAQLDEL